MSDHEEDLLIQESGQLAHKLNLYKSLPEHKLLPAPQSGIDSLGRSSDCAQGLNRTMQPHTGPGEKSPQNWEDQAAIATWSY